MSWSVILVAVVALVGACGSERKPERQPPPREVNDRIPPEPPPVEPDAALACTPGESFCEGEDVISCTSAGARGSKLRSCNGGCRAGACIDTCGAHDVELIYLVDHDNKFLSFDPKKLPGDPFRVIGTLSCEAKPISMAVDRQGLAWVLHRSSRLFRVSLFDAKCIGETVVDDSGVEYGMGFVTDGKGATTETLYVAENDDAMTFSAIRSDRTRAARARRETVGAITPKGARNPELTGTGNGELFAFFPGPHLGFVQQVDRATGKLIGPKWAIPGKGDASNGAYAFAHWGGVFYVFIVPDAANDRRSVVYAIERKTGSTKQVRSGDPYTIVGAGVSTCAPLLEAAPE